MIRTNSDSELVAVRIIERMTNKKALRQAKERQEELDRVLERVDKIYGNFEKPKTLKREFSNVAELLRDSSSDETQFEYVDDFEALERKISSQKWRADHLKKVTIFVVGYSQIASDRLRILEEVNQFFINNEDAFDWFIERNEKMLRKTTNNNDNEINEPDYGDDDDDEELSFGIDKAVDDCRALTQQLGQVNNEMIDYIVKYMQNKSNNKGKKKLEKSLENAIAESHKLQNNLSEMSKKMADKETKIKSLMEQLEAKTKEVQKEKNHANSIKKAALESDKLRAEIVEKNERIMHLETDLEQMKLKVEEVQIADNVKRLAAEKSATDLMEKNKQLEEAMDHQRVAFDKDKSNLKRKHESELKKLQQDYEDSLKELKSQHQREIDQLHNTIEDQQSQYNSLELELHQYMAQHTPKLDSKAHTNLSSEFDENAIAIRLSDSEDEEEEGTSRKQHQESGANSIEFRREISTALSVTGSGKSSAKDIIEFTDSPALEDEKFWSSVPRNQTIGRFLQYRKKARAAISDLTKRLDDQINSTNRQINALKSQHQAHHRKWQIDRNKLIDAVRKVNSENLGSQIIADEFLQGIQSLFSEFEDEACKQDSIEKDDKLRELSFNGLVKRIASEMDLISSAEEPLKDLLQELIKKCKCLDEKTKITLPKFATMVELSRNSKNTKIDQLLVTMETQTDEEYLVNEEWDVMFPPDNTEEKQMKDACVSASPSLLKISLIGSSDPEYTNNSTNPIGHTPSLFDEGVTKENSRTPKTGMTLIKHPIVVDYLHTYDVVLTFKERLLYILEHKEKMDINDIWRLNELDPVKVRSQHRIIPQIEDIGRSIHKILGTSEDILERILLGKKSNKNFKRQITETKSSRSDGNSSQLIDYINSEMKHLRQDLLKTQKLFISKFNGLNRYFLELKQTTIQISKLQNQPQPLQEVEKPVLKPEIEKEPKYGDPRKVSIMFTRRDSERNLEKLSTVIINHQINDSLYEEAVTKMSEYIEIPPKRLLLLVKKYMHKAEMDKIADYVRLNNHFSKSTFRILDGVEQISENKQRRYSELLAYFREERVIRAQNMMKTFDQIQQETKVNLIRPVISKTMRDLVPKCVELEHFARTSNIVPVMIQKLNNKTNQNVSITGTWNPSVSLEYSSSEAIISPEPRIFEIDINRMLLPVNNVSANYHSPLNQESTNLPPELAVRSYVAVSHPTLVDGNSCYLPNNESNKAIQSRELSKHTPLPPIQSSD